MSAATIAAYQAHTQRNAPTAPPPPPGQRAADLRREARKLARIAKGIADRAVELNAAADAIEANANRKAKP